MSDILTPAMVQVVAARPLAPVYRVMSSGNLVGDFATFDAALAVYRRTPHAELYRHDLAVQYGYLSGLTAAEREAVEQ